MTTGVNPTWEIVPGNVTLAELRAIYFQNRSVSLGQNAWRKVEVGHQAVLDIVAKGEPVYGINTGFGLLANTQIANDQLAKLQHNLVLSHAAGVGEHFNEKVVRLIICLKIASLSHGNSGVSPDAIRLLINLINHELIPCIPMKGSVGASGDLAPLAHLTLTVIGEGETYYQGRRMAATEALAACGLQPITLGAKEGLALLNGTQVSTALALAGLFELENLFAAATVAGALSVDGMKGSVVPFDPRIHQLRGQVGQTQIAEKYLNLLQDSKILESHIDCAKVQDPYSLRCQPQVMGACLDLMHNAGAVLIREANGVTDNPLIFPGTLEALSGGNFHAEPIAMAADTLALAIAEIGAISERRIAVLVDPKMSGLPPFLVENSGLNSGFMIAQVSAAALASENKSLAHPASVDSLPTSANQEDHVSMATFAARRLLDMVENSTGIIAIELLAATQAVECHEPHKTSSILQRVVADLRQRVPSYDKDRFFAPDIKTAGVMISEGYFYPLADDVMPTGLYAE